MRHGLLAAFAISLAFVACKQREYNSGSDSAAAGTGKSECALEEFEGTYTLDKCDGRAGYFPIAVTQVDMKVSEGKLAVTYNTAHDHGDWDIGVKISTRLYLDPKNQKQRIRQNGCRVERDFGWFSRDQQSLTMDPVSKVVTLKTVFTEFREKLECTLKRRVEK